jgi:hypothetical protein
MTYKRLPEGKVLIYLLRDPQTQEVRYVGKTVWPLAHRLNHHCARYALNAVSHKSSWIKSLLAQDLRPTIELIEETTDEFWIEREQFWIAFYNKENRLTNLALGGQGPHGWTMREETKAKLSELAKNRTGWHHTEETKKKISKSSQGKHNYVLTPEQRAKISTAHKGRKFTEEHRRKIGEARSAAHRKQKSGEVRE